MQGRRKFLQSAGALMAVGSVGTVSARSRGRSNESSAKIGEAFHKGLESGGVSAAKEALQNHGLNPTIKSTQDFQIENEQESASQGEDTSDGEVSTQLAYKDPKKSDSKLIVATSDSGNGEVMINVGMRLESCNGTARNSWWCPDAIGIGYIESDWAPIGTPSVDVTRDHTARFTSDDVSEDALAGTVNIKNHTSVGGCDSIPTAWATLSGEFRQRDGGEPSTIWGSYTHTFAGSPTSAIKGISGGKGGLSVELSAGAAPAWSIADPVYPEDDL